MSLAALVCAAYARGPLYGDQHSYPPSFVQRRCSYPLALAGRSLVSLPRSARTARPGKPSAIGTSHDAAGSHNQSGSYGAPKNVDRLNSRSPVEDKSQSNRPVPSMTFPDTPMPATPLIRVLETIDLSSTNVEHFLELAERAEAAPPSQEPPQQQPE